MLRYIAAVGMSVVAVGAGAGECWAGWGDPPPGSSCCTPPGPPVVGSAPCCPRPGLFARIRERMQARKCARTACSSCPSECCPAPRPGLFQRLRDRASQRRGYFVPACP